MYSPGYTSHHGENGCADWPRHECLRGYQVRDLPRAATWALDFATVIFVMSLSATMSHFVLTRDERLRREMVSNELRYRLLFWKSLTGAYRSTLDGRILDCNVAFCRMLGYHQRIRRRESGLRIIRRSPKGCAYPPRRIANRKRDDKCKHCRG